MTKNKNLYPGINPHLNSRLQTSGGGWESFHAGCIERLADELDANIPQNYYAFTEKSLQITRVNSATQASVSKPTRPKPDIITVKEGSSPSASPTMPVATPTLTLPVTESFTDEDDMLAVMIYRFEDDLPGKPITHFEVLSPGNKPGGAHYDQYMRNRRQTLESGLRLVEMDWLHETHPIIALIPSYKERDEGAFPYSIIVSDPRPTLIDGTTDIYGFGLMNALPIINLPLDGDEVVTIDFGKVYNATIENRRAYGLLTDYAQVPARFETYWAKDQEHIKRKMAEIAEQILRS